MLKFCPFGVMELLLPLGVENCEGLPFGFPPGVAPSSSDSESSESEF